MTGSRCGFHFIALLHAEGLIEEFGLQAVGDEFAFRQPFREAGPDLTIGEKDAELIEHFRRDFEIRYRSCGSAEIRWRSW